MTEMNRNKIFVVAIGFLLVFLMLWSPGLYMLERVGVVELEDWANYQEPRIHDDSVPFSAFLNRFEELKAGLSNIYINYLPFYNQLVVTTNNMEQGMNNFMTNTFGGGGLATAAVTDEVLDMLGLDAAEVEDGEDAPVPLTFRSRLVGTNNNLRHYAVESSWGHYFMERIYMGTMEQFHTNAAQNAANINRIANARPELYVYMYIAPTLQDQRYFNDIIPTELATYAALERFISQLNDSITVDQLDISTLARRLELLYMTDHHWNSMGRYEGYTDIINMMNQRTPDIGPPRPLLGIDDFGVQLRGSFARLPQFNDRRFYDNFDDLILDLPEFTSRGSHIRNLRPQYLAGNINRDVFFSHYDEYFDRASHVHFPNNDTGRNLMVLGDSYVWSVLEIIGSHFDNAYMFGMGGNPGRDNPLEFEAFVDQHDITHLLFLHYGPNVVHQASGYMNFVITR